MFQALQLIFHALCVVPWINYLAPVFFSLLLVMFYIYPNASQYDNTLFSFTLSSCLK